MPNCTLRDLNDVAVKEEKLKICRWQVNLLATLYPVPCTLKNDSSSVQSAAMTNKLIAVVTGSSRGIGKAIATQLAQSQTPLVVYATSRQEKDLDIATTGDNEVRYAPLDISDKSTIDKLVSQLDRVDILVNNAGINIDDNYNYENAKKTFDVNYRGTLHSCQAFLKVMPANGTSRIVNVTSGACQLGNYAEPIQKRFRDPSMTLADLDAMADEYFAAVRDGKEEETGWKHVDASYSVSKSCVTAMTAVLARENPGVLINCCCPGWVRTDMGSQVGEGGKSPDDGAKIPVRLAIADIDGVTGRYWNNEDKESTADGRICEW